MRYVVNCRMEDFNVYIGRPSIWGNPYSHLPGDRTIATLQCETREESIQKYEEWIMTRPDLIAKAKAELKGKILGCWCKPYACHGDILARLANG